MALEAMAAPIDRAPSSDAAKAAARLLDALSMCDEVVSSLRGLQTKHGRKLSMRANKDLEVMAKALRVINREGRR